MNSPKPTRIIEPQILSRLGQHLERSLNFRVDQDGGEITSESLDIGLLARLDSIVWLSLETSLAPFVIREVMRDEGVGAEYTGDGQFSASLPALFKVASPNTWSPVTVKLAAFLLQILHALWPFDPSGLAAKQLLFAPHLRLLLEVFFDHPVKQCHGKNVGHSFRNTERLQADVYNDFVVQFRQAMLARKLLRRERHNWDFGSRENIANLNVYLDDLFARHPSLTVLHLRLFHARERANLITAPVEDQHRDLKALRASRTLFFDRMRRKPALFTDDPRHIWAILPSLDGGYDLHLTLLFDTAALQKVLDDKKVEAEQAGTIWEDHADQAGAYWVKVATSGRGSYLRGDRCLWLYGPDWVHGEVRADDFARREKLKETLGYLALRRALVRLKNEPPGEYFGMPERKERAPRRSLKRG